MFLNRVEYFMENETDIHVNKYALSPCGSFDCATSLKLTYMIRVTQAFLIYLNFNGSEKTMLFLRSIEIYLLHTCTASKWEFHDL